MAAQAPDQETTTSSREAVRIRERLVRVQDGLKRARAEVRVLQEQVAHLQDVADDAETQALVAETPLADREWQVARRDRDNLAGLLDEARGAVETLSQKRDRLLDQLLETEGST